MTAEPRKNEPIRWPVPCVVALILLCTLALAIHSRRAPKAQASESLVRALSDAAVNNIAELPVRSGTVSSYVDATARELSTPARVTRRLPVPQPSFQPPPRRTIPAIELTGIIGLPGRTKALLEISTSGAGGATRRAMVQKGEFIDGIEIVDIDPLKGQVLIRNNGVESVLGLKTPQLSAAAPRAEPLQLAASFSTPPANWPPFYGDLEGHLEVRINNPNLFSVRVGLRSGGRGKDFIVGPLGGQSVNVSSGHFVTWFQYSTDPAGMYQGDNFTVRDRSVQITITKVVNGNYAIRKVN